MEQISFEVEAIIEKLERDLKKIKTNKISTMEYKLNIQDENPLWRNYMDNVNGEERYMKEVILNLSIQSKSFANYSESEFEQKLLSDIHFKERWGYK